MCSLMSQKARYLESFRDFISTYNVYKDNDKPIADINDKHNVFNDKRDINCLVEDILDMSLCPNCLFI